MDVDVALGGARRLSVDIANLSYRLALLESEREMLHGLSLALTPGTWKRSMQPVPQEDLVHDQDDTSAGEVEGVITISGQEAALLEEIISRLQNLS